MSRATPKREPPVEVKTTTVAVWEKPPAELPRPFPYKPARPVGRTFFMAKDRSVHKFD